MSEYGSEGLRVRLRGLSEHGSVAYFVERPTRETSAEQYSDTVPKYVSSDFGAAVDKLIVALYCAMPRDYLSATPLLCAMGFFGVAAWPIGCDTPFLSMSPHGEHVKWRCNTPPPQTKGVSQRYLCDKIKTRQNRFDTPLCDTISEGYCAIWGGISHWAAKLTELCKGVWNPGPSDQE